MNKKELIKALKEEIKLTAETIRINKASHKHNQRLFSRQEKVGYKPIKVYPFGYNSWLKTQQIDEVSYFETYKLNEYDSPFNCDIHTAKSHLTTLHIVYNMLRNNKKHCHSDERNQYYVQWRKDLIEGTLNRITETENAVI
jgi:hypothetical protein